MKYIYVISKMMTVYPSMSLYVMSSYSFIRSHHKIEVDVMYLHGL